VDSVERARVRMRVLGGITVASLLAPVVLLFVGSPLVGRVEGESAFAGNSLVQTVQDSTVVCTVPELHGKSGFLLSYTANFTGPSTYPASLDVYTGNANHSTILAFILSATFQNQQKGLLVDRKRCRDTSTFVPLTHARAVSDRRGFVASIAVRSYATRKPVAFGFLNRSGFGGLYTSRGCVPHS
jgi:hypothetical protein